MDDAPPIGPVRRRDRAVEDDAWVRDFLLRAQYGSVATEAAGQPFINPVVFVYEPESHALFFHTGREGQIFANLAANPRLCFGASHLLGLRPGASAAQFDVAYESVAVFGRAELVEEREEAARVLRLILEKYFPELRYGEDYAAAASDQLARTAVWRVPVRVWRGKRNPTGASEAE